jgi:excisionase family DNA binding protein
MRDHDELEGAKVIYKPGDLADRWEVSVDTVMDMIHKSKVEHFKVGRQYRVTHEAVIEYERGRVSA